VAESVKRPFLFTIFLSFDAKARFKAEWIDGQRKFGKRVAGAYPSGEGRGMAMGAGTTAGVVFRLRG
jgi:hypothetical protein